jgi:uncharacterized membrane protein YcaP (DUF421 family)
MATLFQFQVSAWELVARGTLIYWFLFVLFRFALRRDTGSVGLADILVVVLIADASQNGMAGEYRSVSEAFVLIATIAAWNFWIDWMSFRFPWFARFAEPQVVALIRHGTLLRANMRREMVTEEDLQSQLREQGIGSVSEVKFAAIEPDGKISAVPYARNGTGKKRQRVPGAG